jgi:hypothetical protein
MSNIEVLKGKKLGYELHLLNFTSAFKIPCSLFDILLELARTTHSTTPSPGVSSLHLPACGLRIRSATQYY